MLIGQLARATFGTIAITIVGRYSKRSAVRPFVFPLCVHGVLECLAGRKPDRSRCGNLNLPAGRRVRADANCACTPLIADLIYHEIRRLVGT
jgi:hypothetical protein